MSVSKGRWKRDTQIVFLDHCGIKVLRLPKDWCHSLKELYLDHNNIQIIDFKAPWAKNLGNDDKHTTVIFCISQTINFKNSNSETLSVAGNRVEAVVGCEGLEQIRSLTLSYNQNLCDLGFLGREGGNPGLSTKLEVLRVRACGIAHLEQLSSLILLGSLRKLDLRDNPIGESDYVARFVLHLCPRLEELNGVAVGQYPTLEYSHWQARSRMANMMTSLALASASRPHLVYIPPGDHQPPLGSRQINPMIGAVKALIGDHGSAADRAGDGAAMSEFARRLAGARGAAEARAELQDAIAKLQERHAKLPEEVEQRRSPTRKAPSPPLGAKQINKTKAAATVTTTSKNNTTTSTSTTTATTTTITSAADLWPRASAARRRLRKNRTLADQRLDLRKIMAEFGGADVPECISNIRKIRSEELHGGSGRDARLARVEAKLRALYLADRAKQVLEVDALEPEEDFEDEFVASKPASMRRRDTVVAPPKPAPEFSKAEDLLPMTLSTTRVRRDTWAPMPEEARASLFLTQEERNKLRHAAVKSGLSLDGPSEGSGDLEEAAAILRAQEEAEEAERRRRLALASQNSGRHSMALAVVGGQGPERPQEQEDDDDDDSSDDSDDDSDDDDDDDDDNSKSPPPTRAPQNPPARSNLPPNLRNNNANLDLRRKSILNQAAVEIPTRTRRREGTTDSSISTQRLKFEAISARESVSKRTTTVSKDDYEQHMASSAPEVVAETNTNKFRSVVYNAARPEFVPEIKKLGRGSMYEREKSVEALVKDPEAEDVARRARVLSVTSRARSGSTSAKDSEN